MDSRTSRVMVGFRGAGEGVEELTWGQRDVWDLMHRTGRTMNIGGAVPVAPGDTVESIAALLAFIVGRHQALRTRITQADGGPPRQVVVAAGEVPLEIVEAGDGEAPDAVAEALRVRYQTTPFDPAAEWPVRMGVVRAGDKLTHVVVMYYHVVVDGFGIDAVVRDLAHLGDPQAAVAGVTPLELARQQQTAEARRQSGHAIRHWRRQLDRVPARPEPAPVDPGLDEPRFWEVVCVSPALARAVDAVQARTGVGSGAVLLAAYAVALARVTGAGVVAVQVVVSNRFRGGFEEAVGSLRQFGVCVLDTGDASFDDVVAQAFRAMIGAQKHGYYDSVAHAEAIGDRAPAYYLNDRRRPGEEQSAGPDTTVRWGVREDTYDGTFYLHIEDDTIGYSLWGDTFRHPPEAIERCARDIEAIVVTAAGR